MKTTSKASINQQVRNIGIDVGKSFLDIYILELDRHWQVQNSRSDINTLVKGLKRFKLTRIVVEATGGYERNVVEAFAEAELPVVVVQPMNVRQFAKAQGILAKTDKIDARLIAVFGAEIRDRRQATAGARFIKGCLWCRNIWLASLCWRLSCRLLSNAQLSIENAFRAFHGS